MDRKYFLITPFILLLFAIPIQATETFTDDFNTPHDYVVDFVIGTGWDGLIGLGENETVDVLDANITNAPRDANLTGFLYMQSTGSNWDTFDPMGPFLYKIASGDFIVEVEVVDITCCFGSIWVAHNDSAVMARVPNLADAGDGEDHVTMNYFSAWCGHNGRSVDNGLEDEFGCSGGVCNDERFIQLERAGNVFHLRKSSDGITWTYLADSAETGTYERTDMSGLDLQVGLMHSVYSAETGYVVFDNFKLTADAFPQYLNLNAHTPFPQNGATEVDPYTTLRWKSGKYVQDVNGHEVYVSTNFNDVNDANNSIKTVLTDANYVPDEGFFFINRTHYWRVDEVNDACSPYIWEGDVWSFETTCKATKRQSFIPEDPPLLWIPCEYSITQDLYFSPDFEDVNSSSPDALLAADLPGDANDYSLLPTPLYPGTTYYWKVDSNCGQLGIARGDVWEFSTGYTYMLCDDFEDWDWPWPPWPPTFWDGIVGSECLIYIGTDINDGHLTIESAGCGWADNDHGVLLYKDIAGDFAATVEISDFQGLYTPGHADAVATNNAGIMARVSDLDLAGPGEDWISIDYFPGWNVGNIIRHCNDGVRYELGNEETGWEAYRFLQMQRYGNTFHLSRSPDGIIYHPSLESPVERADFDDLALQVGLHHSTFGPAAWAEYDNFCVGRNAILKAYAPNPPSGGYLDLLDCILSWTKGDFAVQHRLYFSSDFNDVNDRAEDANRGHEEVVPIGGGRFSYDACYYESLAIGQDYYWCIDEINDPYLWPGDVWRFTVQDYSPIDTFESYNGTGKAKPPPVGSLKKVWHDGNYGFSIFPEIVGTNGSLVQLNTDTFDGSPNYAHYQPEDIAQSGGKSMKFYYDNDGYVTWETDLYGCYAGPESCNYIPFPDTYLSEAYAAVDDDAAEINLDSLDLKRDWSSYKVLKLSFYGDPNNDIEPMYAGLEDGSGNLAVIYHPDSNCIINNSWQDWHIALQDFADANNVDLTDVVRIYLGLGNKYNQQPGGTGLIFVDDIQLLAYSVCAPEYGEPAGDLSDDCMVNHDDLEIMSEEWLTAGIKADIIDNDNVDWFDFTVMANDWLTEPVLLGD